MEMSKSILIDQNGIPHVHMLTFSSHFLKIFLNDRETSYVHVSTKLTHSWKHFYYRQLGKQLNRIVDLHAELAGRIELCILVKDFNVPPISEARVALLVLRL